MAPKASHGEYSHRGGPPLDDSYAPLLHQDDPYMIEDLRREAHRWEDPLRRDPMEEEVRRADYMDMDISRRELMEDDYHGEYQEDYVEDMHRRGFRESGNVPRPGYREEMPPGPPYPEEGYPQDAPPHRRPYPENDPLKQFYSEEVNRGRVHSAEAAEPRGRPYPIDDPHGPAYPEGDPHSYPPEDPERGYPGEAPRKRAYPEEEPRRIYIEYSHGSGLVDERSRQRAAPSDPYTADARRGRYLEDETQHRAYPEDEPLGPGYPEADPHRRSLDRDPNRHGNANGAGRQGAGDPEAKRMNLYDKDHLLEMVKAFRQERRRPPQEGAEGGPRPRFRGPPTSNRPPGGAKAISNVPEPFKRFLERSESDEDHRKRKRKSRFSDATKDEMEVVQGM